LGEFLEVEEKAVTLAASLQADEAELKAYLEGNPPVNEINPMTTPSAHYTFRFVLQPDGSRRF
jgi:hypothetical protein